MAQEIETLAPDPDGHESNWMALPYNLKFKASKLYTIPPEDLTLQPIVRDLRREWKPHNENLASELSGHSTNIRFHRACSWLQQVEEMPQNAEADLLLTGQWIAFNALYGRWDERSAEPCGDRACWRGFLDRIRELDADKAIAAMLDDHKGLVLAILDDACIEGGFWRNALFDLARRTTRDRRQANSWYIEKRYGQILEETGGRVYYLRCQIMLGASTYGSRLNRDSLRRCSQFMANLLPGVLTVWLHDGAEEDWGPMCYPPST